MHVVNAVLLQQSMEELAFSFPKKFFISVFYPAGAMREWNDQGEDK